MIFSLERAAVVLAILERISGFDPSLEMIAPRYLKFSTSSSGRPFILISLWKPFGLFVISFVRMSIMASPPAWTNSAGMLSKPADFPIFSALTAASTSSRRIG